MFKLRITIFCLIDFLTKGSLGMEEIVNFYFISRMNFKIMLKLRIAKLCQIHFLAMASIGKEENTKLTRKIENINYISRTMFKLMTILFTDDQGITV